MADGSFGWRWLSTESADVDEKRLRLTGLLNAVDGRSAAESGDPRETSFLRQRISVLIQRFKFNAILISETFFSTDEAPDL